MCGEWCSEAAIRSTGTHEAAERLVWITNLSAPYRHPVWSFIAARSDFRVGLLGSSEPNRRWTSALPAGVGMLALNAVQTVILGRPLYLLRRAAFSTLTSGDCVILPGWENPASWQLRVEALLRRIACVGFYESTPKSHHFHSGLIPRIRGWYFRHLDCVLTVGQSSQAAVLAMGVDPTRVISTHNSVDVSVLRAGTAALPAADERVRGNRFVYVGQLISRKNVASLIEALALCPPGFSLELIGEGPMATELVADAERRGLTDRVTFTGYLQPEALGGHLARAGTIVLPSTEEVYGLAPAEALSVGLHAIVSAAAGIASDIQGMKGVWTVRPTPQSIATAMTASSEAWAGPIQDPEILRWTAEQMADDVLEACRRAISHRRSGRRSP